MKRLFTIDLKDYEEGWREFRRPSVRAIILNERGEIALIYSTNWHYYKFPGGGIEEGETRLEALVREVREETGMSVILDSVEEFGEVLRLQKGEEPDTKFIQENFYYTCSVEDEIGEQELDEQEQEAGFVLRFVPIEEAIRVNNEYARSGGRKWTMVERERRVLELVKGLREEEQ